MLLITWIQTRRSKIGFSTWIHRKLEEASTRAGLKTYTANNHMVSGTRLVFQEKKVLEQGKSGGNSKKSFAEMDEDGNLKNGIGIQID
jgi:hypothetical protein